MAIRPVGVEFRAGSFARGHIRQKTKSGKPWVKFI